MRRPSRWTHIEMKIPMSLFASFVPREWSEEVYARSPPFVIETVSGRVFVVPRDKDAEATLDSISSPLGLKKVLQGRVSYLVSRGSTVKGLREFDWYVRRSWRNKELRALWALAYIGEKGDWTQTQLRLQYVAEVAGLTINECRGALQTLFHLPNERGSIQGLAESALDRRLIEQTLEKKVAELPIWTEERVMSVLCSGPGESVSELYEAVLAQGVSIGAIYKVSEHLKTQGYVYTQRHYRVSERGPMREMLTADCGNCFFGYSGPDKCMEDALRQIEYMLQRDYGKKPTDEERSTLFSITKSIPYACRTNRRVLASLRLMHEVGSIANDERVSSMLKIIKEGYGVDLSANLPRTQSE